jgi:hypothetical protein
MSKVFQGLEAIEESFVCASKHIGNRYSGAEECTTFTPLAHPWDIYGEHLCMILLVSPGLRITFKVFFSASSAEKIFGTFKGSSARESSQERGFSRQEERTSLNFMKEYCNGVCGCVKTILVEDSTAEHALGMSIPVLCKGFDQVLFQNREKRLPNRRIWGLKIQEQSLVCTLVTTVLDTSLLHRISWNGSLLAATSQESHIEVL